MTRRSWTNSLIVIVCLATAGLVQAQDVATGRDDPTLRELQQQLDTQAAELRQLRALVRPSQGGPVSWSNKDTTSQPDASIEHRLTAVEQVLASAADGEENPWQKKFNVKVGGRIMYDSTYGTDDNLERTAVGRGFQNGHEFRRVRLYAEGEGYGMFEYKLQVDFAEFNNPVAKDVYLGWSESPIGKLWIGQFKEPFSLEELTSSNHITFLERALPNEMVPSRSAGVMLFDQWPDERGTWEIGSFFDDLQQTDVADDGDVDNRDSEFRSIDVRLTRLLWYDEPTDGRYLVHVGGAFRHVNVSNDPNTIRFRARPEIHDTFRLLGVTTGPLDTYQQYGVEAAAVWGPLSVQGEWILTDLQGDRDANLQGGYVFVSYFLTGENRVYSKSRSTFGRIKPYENFWWVDDTGSLCCHGSGAWELAARYSNLDYDSSGVTGIGGSNGTRGELNNFTFGVNWYWNPYMHVTFNYVHSELDDAVTGQNADVDAFLTRCHVDF